MVVHVWGGYIIFCVILCVIRVCPNDTSLFQWLTKRPRIRKCWVVSGLHVVACCRLELLKFSLLK